jgi:hypothetical protein
MKGACRPLALAGQATLFVSAYSTFDDCAREATLSRNRNHSSKVSSWRFREDDFGTLTYGYWNFGDLRISGHPQTAISGHSQMDIGHRCHGGEASESWTWRVMESWTPTILIFLPLLFDPSCEELRFETVESAETVGKTMSAGSGALGCSRTLGNHINARSGRCGQKQTLALQVICREARVESGPLRR